MKELAALALKRGIVTFYRMILKKNVITETGSGDWWKAVPRFLSTCKMLKQLHTGLIIVSPIRACGYWRRGIRL
jgi:hypothetical protein